MRCAFCSDAPAPVRLRYVLIATGECDEWACQECARAIVYTYPALWSRL